jgi:bacterioferritin-associated ferredoxin
VTGPCRNACLAQLQDRLQRGTQCGSCLLELRRLAQTGVAAANAAAVV